MTGNIGNGELSLVKQNILVSLIKTVYSNLLIYFRFDLLLLSYPCQYNPQFFLFMQWNYARFVLKFGLHDYQQLV